MDMYLKQIKWILLEKKSGSETVEVMKLKLPYHEKYFFLCEKIIKLMPKLNSYVKSFELFEESR